MMSKIAISKNESGTYVLKGCPISCLSPLSCQSIGCKHWKGYMFKNLFYNGQQNHIGGQWRKVILGEVIIADYVMCNKKEK